jgi:hypothetical protein
MRSNVRIVERADHGGWLLQWDADTSEICETAMAALNAIKQRDQVLVNAGQDIMITTIVWEPSTRVGRTVVKAVTS